MSFRAPSFKNMQAFIIDQEQMPLTTVQPGGGRL